MTFHWGAGLDQRIKNGKVETRTNRNQKKQKTLESKIKGPDNPTCQLLPKDNERKVKVQE